MAGKHWREAASLILVSKAPSSSSSVKNDFQVLMMKRSSKSKFMPNACVFPGGDKQDNCTVCPNKFQLTIFSENLKSTRNWNFQILSVKKIRQIDVRSALLSQTVNKLSRVFSLLVRFSKDFLLNSCLKLVGTPGKPNSFWFSARCDRQVGFQSGVEMSIETFTATEVATLLPKTLDLRPSPKFFPSGKGSRFPYQCHPRDF